MKRMVAFAAVVWVFLAASSFAGFCDEVPVSADSAGGNGIPSLGGSWNVRGEGTWGDLYVYDSGTITIGSYVDTDGYEVVTDFAYSGAIRDGAGNVLLNDNYSLTRADLNGGLKVTSKTFWIRIFGSGQDSRFDFTLFDDENASARRSGRVLGKSVNANYVFGRAASSASGSGGGGCTVGASPFVILLAAPLLFSLIRK